MKKINFDDPFLRKNIEKDNEIIYEKSNHLQYIENIHNNVDFSFNNLIIKDIKKKYSSYKSQDKLKHRYDPEQHITLQELINKLYTSNLKCYYCNDDICLMYKNKNENKQWSLERFDNNLGHYNSNTCITCLQCNLKRRNENHEYFKFSKQLSVKKVDT